MHCAAAKYTAGLSIWRSSFFSSLSQGVRLRTVRLTERASWWPMSTVPVLRDSRNLPVLRGWGFFKSGIMLVSTKKNVCPHKCCSRVKCSGSILKVDFWNVNRALLPMQFVTHRSGSPSGPCCSVSGRREPRPFSFVRRSVICAINRNPPVFYRPFCTSVGDFHLKVIRQVGHSTYRFACLTPACGVANKRCC